MSDACSAPAAPTPEIDEHSEQPWWKDREILLPIASGIFFLLGLVAEWFATGTVFFWIGLILGASTFVPGAVRGLFTSGKLGISLLMTISAIGAILLGYVEEAAALAFLFSIAEALEDKAMDRAKAGLRSLLKLSPENATVLRNNHPTLVAVKDLKIGDVIRVLPGERIATDGIVNSGTSSIDTSAVTGESIPVFVSQGDSVSAGTVNTVGVLEIIATAAGTYNSLTALVKLVEQAQNDRGQRARLADRIAKPLVPGILIVALLVGIIGSIFGDPAVWITRALVVLVAASPCALAIAVPVTVISAIGAASKFGIIVKSGAAFENLGTLRRIAMDKTGTLTRNESSVAQVYAVDSTSQEEVLTLAATLEAQSTHPLATAIKNAASSTLETTHITEQPGLGLSGHIDGAEISVGSPRWIAPAALSEVVEDMENSGQSCVMVARDGKVIGAIGVRDELRLEAKEAVTQLQDQGIKVMMLSGDNYRTASALADMAGISEVHAQLSPADKATLISQSVQDSPTGMIGDGINDAPALATATVGIAMGVHGSDAAIESAEVAFVGNDLRLIPLAINHARRGRAIMNQNIVLSLLIIVILLPLAITGVLGLAAVVLIHEVAEVLVICNGLRAAKTKRP